MSDGSLSQDEIDALLQGTDTIEMETEQASDTGSALSGQEINEFQNLLKGVVESQSSNLSMLAGKSVNIEPPVVELKLPGEISSALPDEVVEVKIDFSDGLQGEHSYYLPVDLAIKIASLMLGQESIELDEMALSSIGEAVSNITGPTATTIGNKINISIQTAAPVSKRTTKPEIALPQGDKLVKLAYPFTLEGEQQEQIVEVFSSNLVKAVVSGTAGAGGGTAQGQPQEQDMSGLFGNAQPGGSGAQQTFGQPIDTGGLMGQQNPPPNVQPVQFANLQQSNAGGNQGNIGLLMDVFMEMTVELGRTKRLIKEILTIGEGTIIELDKLAGEPVDILVNHKLIAKGEVVVIDENFGVRVTEIVSPMERMADLT